MSKQLKERVAVGYDDTGKPIFKWATGYSKQDLFLAIASLLVEQAKTESTCPSKGTILFGDYLLSFVAAFKSKQEALTKQT